MPNTASHLAYWLVFVGHLFKCLYLFACFTGITWHAKCSKLLDIFLVFGEPHILQSDNGRESTSSVIVQLKDLCSACVVAHDKQCHTQLQDSVEHAKADFKNQGTQTRFSMR